MTFSIRTSVLFSLALAAATTIGCTATSSADDSEGSLESKYSTHGCESLPSTFVLRCPVTGTNGWKGEIVGSKRETIHDRNSAESCKSRGVSSHAYLAVSRPVPGNANGNAFSGDAVPAQYDIESLATTPVTINNLHGLDDNLTEDDGNFRLESDANGNIHTIIDFRGHQVFAIDDPSKVSFEFKGDFPCHVTVPQPVP